MNKTKYLLFLIPLLAAFSCEKIIDINIPEGERKIVVNGLVNPDSLIRINVSRSLSVLEPNEFVYLPESQVTIWKDGQELGSMVHEKNGFFVLNGHTPVAGSEYQIEVQYPGLQTVTSSAVLPDPVPFSEIDTTYEQSDPFFGGSWKLKFDFQDQPGRDYYGLSITATHKVFDYYTMTYLDSLTTYPVYFNFLDTGEGPQGPFVEEGASVYFGNKVFFSDDLFADKKMEINIELSKYSFFDADTVRLDVSLEHISESYYLYAVSSGKYDQTSGNPFGEPVSVYTNIANGLGIFSGYSFSRRSLEIIVEKDR